MSTLLVTLDTQLGLLSGEYTETVWTDCVTALGAGFSDVVSTYFTPYSYPQTIYDELGNPVLDGEGNLTYDTIYVTYPSQYTATAILTAARAQLITKIWIKANDS